MSRFTIIPIYLQQTHRHVCHISTYVVCWFHRLLSKYMNPNISNIHTTTDVWDTCILSHTGDMLLFLGSGDMLGCRGEGSLINPLSLLLTD